MLIDAVVLLTAVLLATLHVQLSGIRVVLLLPRAMLGVMLLATVVLYTDVLLTALPVEVRAVLQPRACQNALQ